MKRHRTLINVLLGLMLLVQGLAVSAAPLAGFVDASQAMGSVDDDIPCHQSMVDPSGKHVPSCCDASCPDMSTCALGHIAAIAVSSMVLPESAREIHGFTPIRVATRMISSPLRPPISIQS